MNAKKKSMNKTRETRPGTTRLIVISRAGKLVGTYLPAPPPAEPNAPRGTVVAGPGQRLHEIEIEDAGKFHERGAIPELHKLIRKKLKLK